MPMTPKHVYYDLRLLDGVLARTSLEAARAAYDVGAPFNPNDLRARTEHVVEGPLAFYVSREPGGRAIPDDVHFIR